LYNQFTNYAETLISNTMFLLESVEWWFFCFGSMVGEFSGDFMDLRNHPRMSYRGRTNWPPRWVWLGGKRNERPIGEVGVLKQVSRYSLLTSDGLSLVMEYNNSAYMGLLLFDDFVFSRRIHELLKTLRDHPIAAIGSVEINDTP